MYLVIHIYYNRELNSSGFKRKKYKISKNEYLKIIYKGTFGTVKRQSLFTCIKVIREGRPLKLLLLHQMFIKIQNKINLFQFP